MPRRPEHVRPLLSRLRPTRRGSPAPRSCPHPLMPGAVKPRQLAVRPPRKGPPAPNPQQTALWCLGVCLLPDIPHSFPASGPSGTDPGPLVLCNPTAAEMIRAGTNWFTSQDPPPLSSWGKAMASLWPDADRQRQMSFQTAAPAPLMSVSVAPPAPDFSLLRRHCPAVSAVSVFVSVCLSLPRCPLTALLLPVARFPIVRTLMSPGQAEWGLAASLVSGRCGTLPVSPRNRESWLCRSGLGAAGSTPLSAGPQESCPASGVGHWGVWPTTPSQCGGPLMGSETCRSPSCAAPLRRSGLCIR